MVGRGASRVNELPRVVPCNGIDAFPLKRPHLGTARGAQLRERPLHDECRSTELEAKAIDRSPRDEL
jgi:hypothetical protein